LISSAGTIRPLIPDRTRVEYYGAPRAKRAVCCFN
jgi:hypothetical protein